MMLYTWNSGSKHALSACSKAVQAKRGRTQALVGQVKAVLLFCFVFLSGLYGKNNGSP